MNQQHQPVPPWVGRFLRAICPPELCEEIEGDLEQRYHRDIVRFGRRVAGRRLLRSTLAFFRPGIILRNKFTYALINTIMWRSYFTTALRNVAKNKVFSAINITGLGIGLAVCLLIFQFVSTEWSYDKFHSRFDRIYRITNDRFQNGKLIQHGTITYPAIGPTMAKDFPEIEAYTRLMPGGPLSIRIGDKIFGDDDCEFMDEHFLTVFDFPMLAGDRATALKDPRSIVLTETLAKKYFGVKDGDYTAVVGKELYDGLETQPLKVTGVVADVPETSHLQFKALVSYSTLHAGDQKGADVSWTWSDFRHYVVLRPGVDYREFEKKFPAFSERYFQGDKVSGSVEKFYLQPLADAHLYSDYEYDIAKTASGKAVWAMLIVAVFILVIAWINYINLTTSRALDRAKEVGLRKVMGALKGQLIKQFIFESVLISVMAFAVAMVVVGLAQPFFNNVIGSKLGLMTVLQALDWRSLLVLALVLAAGVLMAGFYPAFVLSSYQPVTVLKGKFTRSGGGRSLRKALVVFQFTAAATLITGTLIVSRQLRFMNDADLGMKLENVMIVTGPRLTPWDSTFINRVETFKDALTQIPDVMSAATSDRLPGARLGRGFDLRLADQPSDNHYTSSFFNVDHDYFDTYGVSVLAGRKFLPGDHKADFKKITAAIINQNAVKLLGIPNAQEAIGKEITIGDDKWTVVGVVNDFHQESLKKPMEPIVFLPTYSTWGPISVKFRSADPAPVIAQVEQVYKKFFPNNAFEYAFIADRYNRQYNDESRFSRVIITFTMLGILISCLGLIGLSSYTAVQRTKEIGIRKALGASLVNIVSLLSTDFMRLVVVAIVLSLPLAYYAMYNWLSNYPYRIPLQWTLFAMPALLILVIAALTISFQVLKTARVNPASTLKYE